MVRSGLRLGFACEGHSNIANAHKTQSPRNAKRPKASPEFYENGNSQNRTDQHGPLKAHPLLPAEFQPMAGCLTSAGQNHRLRGPSFPVWTRASTRIPFSLIPHGYVQLVCQTSPCSMLGASSKAEKIQALSFRRTHALCCRRVGQTTASPASLSRPRWRHELLSLGVI